MCVLHESKGMVEVWEGSNVPGAASQCECLESGEVIGDVGDDHFHDVVWKRGLGLLTLEDPFVRGACLWGRISEELVEPGSSLVPGGHHAG